MFVVDKAYLGKIVVDKLQGAAIVDRGYFLPETIDVFVIQVMTRWQKKNFIRSFARGRSG